MRGLKYHIIISIDSKNHHTSLHNESPEEIKNKRHVSHDKKGYENKPIVNIISNG